MLIGEFVSKIMKKLDLANKHELLCMKKINA